MNLTRRNLLRTGSSFATLAGAAALASCATGSTGALTLPASVTDFIQSAITKYIPTVESIATVAASLFGPGFAAIVQIGSAAINQLIAVLNGVVTTLTPAVAAAARRRGAVANSGVYIGTTSNGIAVTGTPR